MVSKIIYSDEDWKNDLRRLWKKTKLANIKTELFPNIDGRESEYLTTANVLKLNDGIWEFHDLKTSLRLLVILIEELMETEERIAILINVFQFRDGVLNTAKLRITTEQIIVEKPTPPEKSYFSISSAMPAIECCRTMGFIISNRNAEDLIKDFNIELKCENGDKPDEESALFIYERKVMRIRRRSDDRWVIYSVENNLNQL